MLTRLYSQGIFCLLSTWTPHLSLHAYLKLLKYDDWPQHCHVFQFGNKQKLKKSIVYFSLVKAPFVINAGNGDAVPWRSYCPLRRSCWPSTIDLDILKNSIFFVKVKLSFILLIIIFWAQGQGWGPHLPSGALLGAPIVKHEKLEFHSFISEGSRAQVVLYNLPLGAQVPLQ